MEEKGNKNPFTTEDDDDDDNNTLTFKLLQHYHISGSFLYFYVLLLSRCDEEKNTFLSFNGGD